MTPRLEVLIVYLLTSKGPDMAKLERKAALVTGGRAASAWRRPSYITGTELFVDGGFAQV
jgi:hypothetical protein